MMLAETQPGDAPVATAPQTESGEETWARIKEALKHDHGDDIYNSWFRTILFVDLADGLVTLSVPTAFIRHWIRTHYHTGFLERWQAERTGIRSINIVFRTAFRPKGKAHAVPMREPVVVSEGTDEIAPLSDQIPTSASSGCPSSPVENPMTFDTLVEGGSNMFAVAKAKAVAAGSARPLLNPLFVHAASGMGKTHLLNAITQAVDGGQSLFLFAQDLKYFLRDLSPEEAFSEIKVLAIDNIHLVGGQHYSNLFSRTVEYFMRQGRFLVVSSTVKPNNLESLAPSTRARIALGVVAHIDAPSLAMRRRILGQMIQRETVFVEGLEFPDTVADFVAQEISTNCRDLADVVRRLAIAGGITAQPIDIKLAERVLYEMRFARGVKRQTIDDIQRRVALHFNVSPEDLASVRRTRNIVHPRQIAMYLAKTMTPLSLPQIGRRFGNRDHTTVLHAVRKIEGLTQTDPKVAEDVETLKRLLEG